MLSGLGSVVELHQRFERLRGAPRARSSGEIELVEVSPGVWAKPKVRRTPRSTLERLHNALSDLVDAFDDDEHAEDSER